MFSIEFLIEVLPQLMRGLLVTVQATFGGFALALVIGFILAIGQRSKFTIIRLLSGAYIAFIRCTPLLVQLYFAFYVLPSFGIRFSALTTGIVCLGIHIGAYTAEVYRAGIEAVGKGQWEAAQSLGLKPLSVWRYIIIPQAVPPMIPALGNYLIALFKETPLLAAITVIDLFGSANHIAGVTYRYNEPYIAVTVMLLTVSLISAHFVRRLERRYSSERRIQKT